MNIIVCIKQVAGSIKVKINPETDTFIRDYSEIIINPFDEYAIEEALRIREKLGGVVRVITMGPQQAEKAVRGAIAMGADEGYHITDKVLAGSDTWATAYALANGIKTLGEFDLIICGKQAQDGDTAQVGPSIAEMLDLPFVAWVRKIEEISDKSIKLERMMEYGYDIIEMPLPGMITVVKEINEPRMASLKGIMKSKKTPIKTITADDLNVEKDKLGLAGSPTLLLRSSLPEKKTGGEKISGEIPELVEKVKSTVLDLKIIK